MFESESSASRPKLGFQFTVLQAFIGTAICAAFFGAVAWAGWQGACFAMALSGLVMIGVAITKHKRVYIIPGLLMFWGSCSLFDAVPEAKYSSAQYAPRRIVVDVVNEAARPIGAARVLVRAYDKEALPADVPIVPLSGQDDFTKDDRDITDRSGVAVVRYSMKQTAQGLWNKQPLVVIPPYVWIQVEAPGYRPSVVRLSDISGETYDPRQSQGPELEVRLVADEP